MWEAVILTVATLAEINVNKVLEKEGRGRQRLVSSHGHVRRILGFPMSQQMLRRDCASRPRALRAMIDTTGKRKGVDEEIYKGCNAMIQLCQQLCHQKKITVHVKVQEAEGREAVAIEARRIGATWVVLDKHLKRDAKVCMELLQCNIVIETLGAKDTAAEPEAELLNC